MEMPLRMSDYDYEFYHAIWCVYCIWRGCCSFSANDSGGGESAPLTIIVQLCNCSGTEHGQCVWNELQDGYYSNDTFQIVACDCNGTLYEGQ